MVVTRRANRYRAPDRVAPDHHGSHHNDHNLRSPAVERETPPASTAVHRIAPQHTLNGPTQQHFADHTTDSDTDPGGVTR
jgi:hypothetical protein